MIKDLNLILGPRDASEELFYKPIIAEKLDIDPDRITKIHVLRKSVDARRRNIKINLLVKVIWDENPEEFKRSFFEYPNVQNKEEVIVVGAGPAGLFAALRLIELGYRPIVLERGKSVDDRKKDLAKIHKERIINPDSNYGFGEGGAGTFSDGKLYTRAKKRGNVKKILEVFHFHGAQDDILIDAHPHIGTDVLPSVIVNMRNTIINCGGEVNFNTQVIDYIVEENKISGVITQDSKQWKSNNVILATGHSARDVYYKLKEKGISLEAKPFAMGIRIEHPQELIDQIQYNNPTGRGRYLPAASYSFVHQVKDRGVYSFCMCPGGVIVPAATAPGEQVVNGMSASGRNTPFANAGMVVEIHSEDITDFEEYGELAGLKFQEKFEKTAFEKGGGNLTAPAQRMLDFVRGKVSVDLPKNSYHPGVISSDLHNWMPENIVSRLQIGFKEFGRKSNGFLTNDAVILGVESRSSSPVRIPRDRESFEHIVIKGLYPCGEGAGYAGGIVSAAMDGEACANAIAGIDNKLRKIK